MATTATKKQGKLNLQMREMLANSYAFVRGRQYNESMANLTYEELLDAAIEKIEGTKGRSTVRGTILDRIQKIKQEIVQAVDTVKKQPPSYWIIENDGRIDAKDSANTPEKDVASFFGLEG